MPDVWKSSSAARQKQGGRPAILIDSQGCENRVVVIDMSGSDFRVESPQAHFVGEQIRLRVAGQIDHAAEIRWVVGSHIGGIFLEPVQTPWG